MQLLAYIYCFFPLFSPVDPETDAAPMIDYVDDNTSSFSTELPGKPNPLDHFDIAQLFLSHACIRFCYCYWLLLFWCIACFCTCYCYLPAYPKLLSIGWIVIYQWPPLCPDCPAGLSEDPINGIEDQAPAPHITSPLVAWHYWVTIKCRGWYLISTSNVNLLG